MSHRNAPTSEDQRYVRRVVHAEGRTYASIREAARELGVTPVTIRSRLKREITGYFVEEVEVDRPVIPARKDGRPVFFSGERYSSMRAAALALGVTVTQVKRMIERGVKGCYYEDEGQRLDMRRDVRRPVIVEGKCYESIAAAARALNLPRLTVQSRVQSPSFPHYTYQL